MLKTTKALKINYQLKNQNIKILKSDKKNKIFQKFYRLYK